MKPQSKDSYHPRLSGVHSKRWTLGGEGSIVEGRLFGGVEEERRVSTVWSGRVGSQLSIQFAVGSKPPVGAEKLFAWWLEREVVLFCRENDGVFAGILPRAFSDIPRSWVGSGSSVEEIEGLRDVWVERDE